VAAARPAVHLSGWPRRDDSFSGIGRTALGWARVPAVSDCAQRTAI